MSISTIGGHGVSDSLPTMSDGSQVMPVNIGNTTGQSLVNLKQETNLSGVADV